MLGICRPFGLTLRLVGGKCSDHRARIVPGSIIPRRGGCFEEAVPDVFVGPCHPGEALLDPSVANGLTASEKQPVFIVDIERLDLITILPGCRANSCQSRRPAARFESIQGGRFSARFTRIERAGVRINLNKKMIDFAAKKYHICVWLNSRDCPRPQKH